LELMHLQAEGELVKHFEKFSAILEKHKVSFSSLFFFFFFFSILWYFPALTSFYSPPFGET